MTQTTSVEGTAGSSGSPRKVFVSHCSVDKPAVKALVDALRARGIDAWYDEYEIAPGEDIVARLNEGLAERDAGLVVFSANTDQGRWVRSEISTLFHERVEEGKPLIPVILGDGAGIPPLIKPLARVKIEEVDRIVDAINHRRVRPPLGRVPGAAAHAVELRLARRTSGEIELAVALDGSVLASSTHDEIPRELLRLRDEFLSGYRHAALRSPRANERTAKEATIAALGREMAAFCIPEPAAARIEALLEGEGMIPGASIEVAIRAEDSDLASLPYESLRVPGRDRLLVDHPAVAMIRRPVQLAQPHPGSLPGPLKILVAVGAPDEGKTANNVLDHERELQKILDAVEPAQRLDNVEVRILEASDPATIGDALKRDQYHVLYITCHGKPGALELDDEDGNAVDATATDLLDTLRAAQRPAPLIFLNSCHGAVDNDHAASLAESLLRGGVPAVLAMQTSVSDGYGTALAHAFFEDLSREGVLASRALAGARRALERKRRDAIARGDEEGLIFPEYATATLFVAGIESPLVDFSSDKRPLQARPVHELGGQVPQLRQDDLIGRRGELRRALWVLRPARDSADAARTVDGLRKSSALALVGIGGVGKSTIAGRAMRRLAEDGLLVASHVGKWDLGAIASAVGDALLESANSALKARGKELVDRDLDDERRLRLLARSFADAPMLLVLDDFEQNLTRDGAAFVDPDLPRYLAALVSVAQRGRLLVTCRFPLPGFAGRIATAAVGPLSDGDVRKLVLRLPGLRRADTAVLRTVLRTIGNHPRVLELLDALVRGGVGRLPHVTIKLNDLLARSATEVPEAASGDLQEALRQSLVLGARDVFLDELLAIARQRGLADVLLQAAVSNLPVDAAGVAYMLADGPAAPETVAQVTRALRALEDMSLVVRMPEGGAWVHRWTAEGLAQAQPRDHHRARCVRAGRYRRWLARNQSHDVNDLIEAVRSFLRAEAWDDALAGSNTVIVVLERYHQTIGVASFVAEVLSAFPDLHPETLWLHSRVGDAYSALGQGEEARKAYAAALAISKRLVAAEPERGDYQRALSMSHLNMADVFRALSQGDEARSAYAAALAISERLAAAEPERADYQRDLTVVYSKMGDLFRALGQGEETHSAYAAALAISERLAAAEPERADYQRTLSVSYSRMADVFIALGRGEEARKAHGAALAINERLAAAEPERADYQRNLSVSYSKMGKLFIAQGEGEKAREAYAADLAIAKRLAAREPERADYQRDLWVSYNNMGHAFIALGQGEEARKAHAAALAIAERLVAAEPERADYQRDLSVSYNNMGDLFRALGQGEEARTAYAASLAIAERIAAAEPERADYQHDLSVAYNKMGDVLRALGQREEARRAYAADLAITERLAAAEPQRADYQSDLCASYQRLAAVAEIDEHMDDARLWSERSLAIAERLAATEPARADFQISLVNNLVTTARYAGSGARALLERAASILRDLAAAGRLAPAERWKIESIAGMLATLS